MGSGLKMKVGILALSGLAGAATLKMEGPTHTSNPAFSKVIMLLDSMSAEIKKEMTAQAAISGDLQKWATQSRKEKTEAIEAGLALINENEKAIEEYAAANAETGVNQEGLEKDIGDEEKSLKEAEEMRKKEADVFKKYESDTRTAIQQLEGALVVLKKFNSLQQLDSKSKQALSQIFSTAATTYVLPLGTGDVEKAQSFLQQTTGGVDSYNNQSSEIWGILTTMKETMEGDLAEQVANETKAVDDFNKMRQAKRDGLKALKDQLFSAKEGLARGQEAVQVAKKTIKEAKATLEADQEFLADVNQRAKADADELRARQTVQKEELCAIAKCKEILEERPLQEDVKCEDLIGSVPGGHAGSSPAGSHPHLFIQTSPSGRVGSGPVGSHPSAFIQTDNRQMMKARSKAMRLLRATNSPQLAMLATQVGLNAFKQVKKSINDLIASLQKKKEDQYAKRDYCIAAFDKNKISSDENSFKLEDLQSVADQKEAEKQKIEQKIEGTKEAIKLLIANTAQATTERKKENAEYQQVFNDQKITIEILATAKQQLTNFYGLQPKSFLVQPGGPAGLKKDGFKKQNSSPVLELLDQIIHEAKETLQLAIDDEQAAEDAYAKLLHAAHAEHKSHQDTLVTDKKALADKEEEINNVSSDMVATLSKLKNLSFEKQSLHVDCDFMINHFDETQDAMEKEIEALVGAINILSGAME